MSTEESLKLKLKKKINLGIGKSKKVPGDSGVQGLRKSNKDYGTENHRRKPRNVQLTESERPERSASSGERNKRTFANKFSKSNKDYSTENHWRKERKVRFAEGEEPERRASSDQRNKRMYAKPDRFSKSSNDYSIENHWRKERNVQLAEGERPKRSTSSGERNKQKYAKPDRFSKSNNDYSTENQWRKEQNVRLAEGEKPERSASFGERNKRIYAKPDIFSKSNKDYSTENHWRKERNVQLAEGEKPERWVSSDQRNKRIYAKPDKFMEDMSYTYGEATSKKRVLREGRYPSEKISLEGKGSNRLELPDGLNSTEKKKQASKLKLKTEKIDGTGSVLVHRDTKSRSAELTPFKTPRKRVQDKRAAGNDPEVDGEKPKKRKRVIRIDPYDISNKRLDDGIAANESTKETKKEDNDDNAEMSMNAQFRAIQPSPSILSFVEENLLGRRRMIDIRRAGYNIELPSPLDNAPSSTSSERERIEENVFRNKLTFFAAAKVSSSFPPPELPEIAFAGRSNVGKSSLLNSLTRQWGVVRTSDKPGLTQTINFFQLGPKLSLVDLPGYGFAYAKEEVKDAWEELVKEYVSTRVGLKRVCLLIDTKWGMKPRDLELIELMERSQTKYQVVLTKTDLVFPIDVARRAMQIEESLKASKSIVQPLMMVSSKTGGGIGCLRKVLAKVTRFAKV